MMWHAIETSGYWRGEIWNRRKDGELIPLIGSISSVHDDKQQLTHYVSVYTDIRQLKDSEAQLEHLARHDPLTQLPNRSAIDQSGTRAAISGQTTAACCPTHAGSGSLQRCK